MDATISSDHHQASSSLPPNQKASPPAKKPKSIRFWSIPMPTDRAALLATATATITQRMRRLFWPTLWARVPLAALPPPRKVHLVLKVHLR